MEPLSFSNLRKTCKFRSPLDTFLFRCNCFISREVCDKSTCEIFKTAVALVEEAKESVQTYGDVFKMIQGAKVEDLSTTSVVFIDPKGQEYKVERVESLEDELHFILKA